MHHEVDSFGANSVTTRTDVLIRERQTMNSQAIDNKSRQLDVATLCMGQ